MSYLRSPSASRRCGSAREKWQPLLLGDCSWLAACAQLKLRTKADPSGRQRLTLTPGSTTHTKHNENTQTRAPGGYICYWCTTAWATDTDSIISSPGPNDWRGTDFTSTETPAKTLRQLGKLLARRTRSRKRGKRDRRGEADKLQWKSRAVNPA